MIDMDYEIISEYLDLWREESEWPECKANVILAVYDILLLLGASESLMRKVLKEDAVKYVCDYMNTTTIPTAMDIANSMKS